MKIKEGPVRGLCGSCKHARIMVDDQNQSTVVCEENHPPFYISRALVSCSDYLETGKLAQWELEKIAWIIEVHPKTKEIGFRPPKKEKD